MMFVDIDYEEWADRHGIDVIDYHCPKCKKTFKTDIPFIDPEAYGLISPEHECGPDYRTTAYVLRDRELAQWIRDLLDAMKNE
jgi:hypothetical protein